MDAEDEGGNAMGEHAGEARRYDSFHVRLWSRPGADGLLRAEVRHLQTDLVEAATTVPAAWLLETLLALLADQPQSNPTRET